VIDAANVPCDLLGFSRPALTIGTSFVARNGFWIKAQPGVEHQQVTVRSAVTTAPAATGFPLVLARRKRPKQCSGPREEASTQKDELAGGVGSFALLPPNDPRCPPCGIGNREPRLDDCETARISPSAGVCSDLSCHLTEPFGTVSGDVCGPTCGEAAAVDGLVQNSIRSNIALRLVHSVASTTRILS
jgi:hypothetical protein